MTARLMFFCLRCDRRIEADRIARLCVPCARGETMETGVCVCGHNRSYHRDQWDQFRGRWDSRCRAEVMAFGVVKEPCRCAQFRDRGQQ